MRANYIYKLHKLHACVEALEWCKDYSTLQKAWAACERGEWMLWLLGKLSGKPGSDARRKLVLACCDCAELGAKYVPEGEPRPAEALRIARAWARSEDGVTLKDLQKAAKAANAAYAACAAADAAWAAAKAADAADAAYVAYAADVAYAAKKAVLKQCADIVRKHYPKAPKI